MYSIICAKKKKKCKQETSLCNASPLTPGLAALTASFTSVRYLRHPHHLPSCYYARLYVQCEGSFFLYIYREYFLVIIRINITLPVCGTKYIYLYIMHLGGKSQC